MVKIDRPRDTSDLVAPDLPDWLRESIAQLPEGFRSIALGYAGLGWVGGFDAGVTAARDRRRGIERIRQMRINRGERPDDGDGDGDGD